MKLYCDKDGSKLVDGKCSKCTEKSTAVLTTESLEKSIGVLEQIAKGVRPVEAAEGKTDKRTPEEANEDAVDEEKEFAKKRSKEGDSVEGPKSTKVTEAEYKSWGGDEEEEEEEPRDSYEDEDDDEDEEPVFRKKSAKSTKKSVAATMSETNGTPMEVSDFLRDLVNVTSNSIDSLRNQVVKSHKFADYQQNFNVGLAAAMIDMGSIVKSLAVAVDALSKTPVSNRKSDVSVPIEKSFTDSSLEGKPQINKSEAAMKISELAKSATSLSEMNRYAEAAIICESTGRIADDIKAKIGLQ